LVELTPLKNKSLVRATAHGKGSSYKVAALFIGMLTHWAVDTIIAVRLAKHESVQWWFEPTVVYA
jgi:hypothetical protein